MTNTTTAIEAINNITKELMAKGYGPIKATEMAKMQYEEELEVQREEVITVKEPLTVDELATHLIAQGVPPLKAVAQAQAVFGKEDTKEVKAPVKEEPKEEEVNMKKVSTEELQEKLAAEKVKQSEKETKVSGRPWFKRAMGRMMVSDKKMLIGQLTLERMQATTPEEVKEIDALIHKLETQESFYKEKVEPLLVKTKGWSVDSSGKLADGLYITGEYAGKGASGLTKAVGKGTQLVGKGIVIAGEAIEESAPTVGKVVEAPFKFAGDTVKVLNGTKEMPKPKATK